MKNPCVLQTFVDFANASHETVFPRERNLIARFLSFDDEKRDGQIGRLTTGSETFSTRNEFKIFVGKTYRSVRFFARLFATPV